MASWDMVVKMVVPTFGSLLRIMEPSFLGCIRHGVESEHSGSSGQEKGSNNPGIALDQRASSRARP
ncbi:hypothetical protein, partial [Pseudomonas sp. UBA6554]|uniref:hypothetical protein n=1 Tax=Pseudomonas sp. UBA6554 TaxID=1947331 RepID=UPI00257E4F59